MVGRVVALVIHDVNNAAHDDARVAAELRAKVHAHGDAMIPRLQTAVRGGEDVRGRDEGASAEVRAIGSLQGDEPRVRARGDGNAADDHDAGPAF